MASDAELGLRDRLAKLSGVKLLRGTKLSVELERLQRQLERLKDDTSDEEIWKRVELARHQDGRTRWTTSNASSRTSSSCAVIATAWTTTRSWPGWAARRTDRRPGRAPERPRSQGAHDRNFGMAYPEGYRKAMRVMGIAAQHGFPLITLVDTPGAYPGVAAEQHGQGGAIAASQATMLRLRCRRSRS